MHTPRILVVDDDPQIQKFLNANLRARGYRTIVAFDGEEALKMMEKELPDLLLLDLMLPRLDGVEVCRRIRKWSQVPIIILSAKDSEKDKVECFNLGADDYITKPFGVEELMARVKTALRHANTSRDTTTRPSVTCGNIEINFAARRVTVDGKEVKLTATEYSLLEELAVNANKVLTHTMLLHRVWGEEYYSEKEYLRVFIGRLRKKLEQDTDNPKYILTDPGIGYHLHNPA
ncbi:MAG: response regulator transcription factor [Dehalococcoidia bacterium]|nr:response regulator transcription factor [Dehalococcoidia bacterium]